MTTPLEAKLKFEDLRMRVLNKEDMSATEYKILIQVMREGRDTASVAANKKTPKRKHNLTDAQVQAAFNDF